MPPIWSSCLIDRRALPKLKFQKSFQYIECIQEGVCKIILFFRRKIGCMLGPSRLGKRGVTASRHLTWSAGCGGREARYDEAWIADGEIVRSRSPDAGINPRA